MPSCCALSHPQRRACSTATVSGESHGKCRRMSAPSTMRSAPSGMSMYPSIRWGT